MKANHSFIDQPKTRSENGVMSNPFVYDKAKYHSEAVEKFGLPESHELHHTACILRWLLENNLMSDWFMKESSSLIDEVRNGSKSVLDLYNSWDGCLVDEMVSQEGNKFGKHYFDFQQGKYIRDYKSTLQGSLPSEYHVAYNEENYSKLRAIIDRRYSRWKKSQTKQWWQFWK